MEVLLADEYGFCFGVERAVEMVEEAVEEGARPIRSLGPLIHNAQEMERLSARGVSTIDSPDEAGSDTIAVIRAHGVTPQVQHELEGRSFKEISAETGVGVNTLLSRKRYAVLHLRERLRSAYEEFTTRDRT